MSARFHQVKSGVIVNVCEESQICGGALLAAEILRGAQNDIKVKLLCHKSLQSTNDVQISYRGGQ